MLAIAALLLWNQQLLISDLRLVWLFYNRLSSVSQVINNLYLTY